MGLGLGGEETGGAAEAGVVDQAVDGEAARLNGLEQAARGLRIGEVFGEDGDGRAPFRQFVGQRLQRGLAAGGEDQVPAFGGVGPGQRRADAGRGAGDQDGGAAVQAATGQEACGAKAASDGGSSASKSAMLIFDRASAAARSAAVRALAT